jgi:hypothetical protein
LNAATHDCKIPILTSTVLQICSRDYGASMFGRVGQRLDHYVVGGDLDLFRHPPVDAHVQLDQNGAAADPGDGGKAPLCEVMS